MKRKSSLARSSGPLSAAAILLAGANLACAADTYSAGQLSIASLGNGPVTYSNVVVSVASLTSGPAGTAPLGSVDSLNTATGQIFVPTVRVGAGTFYNAAVTVGSPFTIGAISGADSYNGANLTISYVQVGTTFYRNAVVGVASVIRVAGGLPAGAWDSYNSGNGELTIPTVQVGAKVYTNVTIKIGNIVSVGGGAGTAQTIAYTAPGAAPIQVGASSAIGAAATSALPVTFVVMTPQSCAVVANSAQLQNFYFTYSGSGFGGSGVASGVLVSTGIYEIDSVNGTAAGQPMGILPTTTLANVNLTGIPYPIYAAGGLAYDNIFYANGGALFDQAGLGLKASGADFNLYYVSGAGYLYVDQVLINEHPPYTSMSMSAAEVNGVVGLANGACNIVAFQNGNYYAGYGYASATPVVLSVPIGIALP